MTNAQELEQALGRYEGYLKADPDNPLLWLHAGDLYHRAGRFDRAIDCYERCLRLAPQQSAARSRLALVMISQHRFAEAEQVLKQLIDTGEADPALSYNLGLALFYQERWQEACDWFTTALDKGLNTASVHAYLTRALHHLGRMDAALEACALWTAAANDADSKGYLALLEMDQGNAARAQALAQEVLKENPDQINAGLVAANAAVEQQDMGYARQQFFAIIRKEPAHGRAWLGLGLIYLYEREYPQAIDALEKASRLMPDNAGTIVALAWTRLAAKDAAGAEATFRHAIRADRNFAESHGGLASVFALQSKIDLAKEEIKIAQRLDPSCFGAAFANSILLKISGKDEHAKELLAKLLQQAPVSGAPALIDHLLAYAKNRPPGPRPDNQNK